jgi:gluconolactonase
VENANQIIHIFDPQGNEIASFGGMASGFTNQVTNLAFGGPDRKTLFVTTAAQGTNGGVFAIDMNIPGLPY